LSWRDTVYILDGHDKNWQFLKNFIVFQVKEAKSFQSVNYLSDVFQIAFVSNKLYWHFLYFFDLSQKKQYCRKNKNKQLTVEKLTEHRQKKKKLAD
jgi:hypothetical protein